MPVANLRVFRPPLSRGQSGNVIFCPGKQVEPLWAGEEKSLVVACFIIEIKEEFQRQSPGKGIFSQVRAVAFLVLMQRFRVETGKEVGVKVKSPYLASGAPNIWNG